MHRDHDSHAGDPGELRAERGLAAAAGAVAADDTDPDVRERQREVEMVQSAEKLQKIGLLAAGIAHDFNSLLTAVLGHASLLAEKIPPGHPERESVDEIIAGSEQAAGLARQLLTYTHVAPTARTTIDANDVVRRAHSLLGPVLGASVACELDLADDLLPVRADPAQLSQVLMNLVMNARDAVNGRGGRIVLRTRNAVETARPNIVLEVEDDGMGMDRDTCNRVFEPFFSTKSGRGGTGLGLAIVEAVVRRHGGYIALESEPGRGTSVRVYLPAVERSASF